MGDTTKKIRFGPRPRGDNVIARGIFTPAHCRHTVAIALYAVARRAKYLVAVLATPQKLFVYWQRISRVILGNAVDIILNRAARDGVFDQRPLGTPVWEKIARMRGRVVRRVAFFLPKRMITSGTPQPAT